MPVTCFIRYQIDPFQRDAFREYAATWGRLLVTVEGTFRTAASPGELA